MAIDFSGTFGKVFLEDDNIMCGIDGTVSSSAFCQKMCLKVSEPNLVTKPHGYNLF